MKGILSLELGFELKKTLGLRSQKPWQGLFPGSYSTGSIVTRMPELCPRVMKNETTDAGGMVQANLFKRYKGKEVELPLTGRS